MRVERVLFRDLDLKDPFFDSLKQDYAEFPHWYRGKSQEHAYVLQDRGVLLGFMYLKLETAAVDDVDPHLPAARRLKLGTLKIEAHGTRLGQRFIKKALDHGVYEDAVELYVTIFPKHRALIQLLKEFGFSQQAVKTSPNGEEMDMRLECCTSLGALSC